jgi:hypothetical protein
MICKNGITHTHVTADEARRCWHSRYNPTPTPPVVASPVIDRITTRQLDYIKILEGDLTYAAKLSKAEASDYIAKLKFRPKENKKPVDPRLEMIKGLLEFVPDGYYATAPDGPGGHVDFLRINRPKPRRSGKNKFVGATVIQTQHSEVWKERLVLWPSGQWSVYRADVIDMLLLVVADHRTCAKRYAIELQSCCVCNTKLTDDRSRHYLIGPICDKKEAWSYVLEEVDDQNDGLTYEELVVRGLPTGPAGWQQRTLTV